MYMTPLALPLLFLLRVNRSGSSQGGQAAAAHLD
jgi:hypothetical protein|tara:strand:+ start:5098 stop:5199 length:102 start_codon:yes stop_codon:yes gene_type:complete